MVKTSSNYSKLLPLVWKRIRTIWITLGLTASVIFVTWSLIAYRPAPEARLALQTDSAVSVAVEEGGWRFTPVGIRGSEAVGFLFFPGSLVDPIAYAPLARATAEAGFPTYLIRLPLRGAFGGARGPEVLNRVDRVTSQTTGITRWVLGGHSLGAVVACDFAARGLKGLSGLILIGTSHPRDVDLSTLSFPVTKIAGTNDGLATTKEVEQNSRKLPGSTNWIWIEGGNHSQFGWYGFQPGDYRATISPSSQHEQMLRAIIATLREIADSRSRL